MRVSACKDITVEFEVDIGIDDLLAEFGQRAEESTADYWRRLLSPLDWMTRIMASIPTEVIEAMPDEARNTLCERLMTEAARYDPAP